jgi:signal transduction histidine kinase
VSPQLQVVLIALVCSGTVGAIGMLAVRVVRRPSMRTALLAVALVSVAAVVAGVAGTARAMFLSPHDLTVATTVSLVAGVAGLVVALLLSRDVVRDVRLLRAAATAVGAGDGSDAVPGRDGSRTTTRTTQRTTLRTTPRTTELREVAEELARSAERLATARDRERALESSRRELVAWVSHDLRTPLAGLRAMAEALEDDLADDPARYHRQMRREVERLSRMVDDLFELSRIQAGALTLTLERIDLGDLVGDVLAGTRPVAAARGVRLDATVGPALVAADGAGLGRVLANLIVNAVRHTPSDGTVEVFAGPDGDDAVLTVSDRCGGIREDDLARVFDPGWRGSSARTPATAAESDAGLTVGAGLGLAIARGIVEAHHGRIDVANIVGGCRFEVRLPRELPAAR